MEKNISVFDMFKIGVGPSSSHTLGPWKAALHCLGEMDAQMGLDNIIGIDILLYGSLAKTGKGHGTDMAVLMGLMGEDPITTDTATIQDKLNLIQNTSHLVLNKMHSIVFIKEQHLQFLKEESLPHHPNALRFVVHAETKQLTFTYYSIGGGFIEKSILDDQGNESIIPVDNTEKVAKAGDTMTGALNIGSTGSPLTVNSTNSNQNKIVLSDNGTTRGYVGATSANCFTVQNASATTTTLTIDNSGNLTAAANITAYSDVRLKKDLVNIENALEIINRMNGYRYTRVDTGQKEIGLVAQQLTGDLPEVVKQNEEYMSVAYDRIVAVLVEAVKELTKRVEALEAK